MKKINIITLGCSKNTVDSEHLAAQLAAMNYKVVFDSDRTDADVVVINTCGFIGDAKQESIDTILRAAMLKQAGKIEELFVVGCLSQRYADELRPELPEVDDFFGVNDWADIVARLGAKWQREQEVERELSTPSHYAYPTEFPDDVIEVMSREKKICRYLDIPFQHISDNQLAAMKRRHTKEDAYRLVRKLRDAIPDIALRTTLLVGYPGESESDFEELQQFVKDCRFERLGVFAYSEEEGTYSATRLTDDVPADVKQSRVDRIMRLQERISLESNARRIGQHMRVIIDRKEGEFYVGRSEYDSPEVDQEIIIDSCGRRLYRGRFYDVHITDCEDYDLYAELV